MKVQKLNFPLVIPDNETTYLNYLEGLVESVDYNSDMMVRRKEDGIVVRICPSSFETFFTIFDVIKRFHTMLNIQVEFSKSMKAGGNISYIINF